jgi:hypothetical protein
VEVTIGKRAAHIIALAVFVISLGYFLSYARYGLAYDEGYLLDGVEKVMEGQVIYRDFHHTYAPGRFYLVAAAFEAFGKSLLVERYIFALLQALKCSLAFLIVWAITGNGFALVAPVLIMMAPGPWHKVFFSSLGFLATYAVMISIGRGMRRLVICGAVVGLCAVFRQDSAAFAVLGGFAGLVFGLAARTTGVRRFAAELGGLLIGLALVGIPVLLYFSWQGALAPMLYKMTKDGMLDNMTNRIPYPGLAAETGIDAAYSAYILPVRLIFYLPFAVYGLAGFILVRNLIVRRFGPRVTEMIVLVTASVLAVNQSVWRSDIGHLLQTQQYVFLLVPVVLASAFSYLARRWPEPGRRRRTLRWGLLLASPALLFWATYGCMKASLDMALMGRFVRESISVGDTEYVGSVLVRAGNDTRLHLERAPVYVRAGEARFFKAIGSFLDEHTSPGNYVLAVPQLQMLYFFYDRKNPTRYAHYRRALDPADEEEYIADIERHGTRYIFLTEPYAGATIGQTAQAFSEYARRVRSWILANYVEVERIGGVRILSRKS